MRPTDDCDVCEGSGVDSGHERFEPVRSAVRENALWSIVILCSHGTRIIGPALEPTMLALKEVVHGEKNIICVGFAVDALNRLANMCPEEGNVLPLVSDLRTNLLTILGESPVHSWETLVRGGLDAGTLSEAMRELHTEHP